LKNVVFCDSEFWHGKNWKLRKYDFKSNQEFWIPKIERNIIINYGLKGFNPITKIKGVGNRNGWQRMTTRERARLQGFII
jgi:G:T-mismatch repair DNA endonuclease (very short patch repair protein)